MLVIAPENVEGQDEFPTVIQTIYDALSTDDLAHYITLPDEFEPMNAFFAPSPDHALQWICSKVDITTLIKRAKEIYTASALPEEEEAPTASPKRKRGEGNRSNRAANRALIERLNANLVQTVASTQDWEYAKAPEGVSNEERKYRDFAQRLPGIGINAVTQMINKAVAVGSVEVIRDWQAILAVWKRQQHYGKRLFQPVAMQDALVGAASQALPASSRMALQQRCSDDRQGPDEAGLTAGETAAFRHLYFDAQKTQVDGIADEMRHRWKMNKLYEEYSRLEREIRFRNQGTGGRGVRYADKAKEHLFTSTYSTYLGVPASKSSHPDLWATFGEYLDWGKRWHMLKSHFGGVGIFGLLPRSAVSNTFIEKTLTQTRVAQWAEMVAHCNNDVAAIATHIEPLFLACMEESEPPQEFLFLEDLDREATIPSMLSLFIHPPNNPPASGAVTQRSIEEVRDSESEEDNLEPIPTSS